MTVHGQRVGESFHDGYWTLREAFQKEKATQFRC